MNHTPDVVEVFAAKFPLLTRFAPIGFWILAVAVIATAVKFFVMGGEPGQDSHAYWLAAQSTDPYGRPPGTRDAFLYSPFFLMLIRPLTWLPWPVFCALWVLIGAAIIYWLVRPLKWQWAVPIGISGLLDLVVGNIWVFLALVAVIGLRHPWAFAWAALTKVTTGVGLVWFAARGEWKRFSIGAGTVAAIVGIGFLIDGDTWRAWIGFLITNQGNTPDPSWSFVLRCLASVALVVMAARKNWPALIPVAMCLATPVLFTLVPWTPLLAVPRLLKATPAKAPASAPSSAGSAPRA
ncbi:MULTISPECIES: glycosyltransferase family 87 protein [Arthrobacter]|uniref:Glycosyltransferase family 87 protein n=2 Tax=Arthrobacter TaxID=1663 RepID=A0ABU9KGQ4_9MICC|nr:glycosyltransferase family 87 protein [Arthrobacter sp. YJM1]MDP5225721.1 glycosyltransferase family 87 protein [Arthrobacter sp. YJM1]